MLLVELLLCFVTHLLHKSLLSYYLIFFQLPKSSLFLDLYHLQLLIEFLFAEPLLEAGPFSDLLHLPCLLSHCLPDEFALEPLLVILSPPSLLQYPVSVCFFSLSRLHIGLQLPQRIIRLLLLQ